MPLLLAPTSAETRNREQLAILKSLSFREGFLIQAASDCTSKHREVVQTRGCVRVFGSQDDRHPKLYRKPLTRVRGAGALSCAALEMKVKDYFVQRRQRFLELF
jgi:hypothetical protein